MTKDNQGEVVIETKQNAEEIREKISKYSTRAKRWYQYEWPLARKPYEGNVTNNHFSLTSTRDHSKIDIEINPRDKGTVIRLSVNPEPFLKMPLTETMFSISFGFGALFILLLGAALVLLDLTSLRAIALVATPLILIMFLAIWISNRFQRQQLQKRVKHHVNFFKDLIESEVGGKVTAEGSIDKMNKNDYGAILRDALAAGLLTFIVFTLFSFLTDSQKWFWKPGSNEFIPFIFGSVLYLVIFWLRKKFKQNKK
jgi:hypothetical protein